MPLSSLEHIYTFGFASDCYTFLEEGQKESYVIALNFDLEANLAQKVIILHVLRSFVNNISSFSN